MFRIPITWLAMVLIGGTAPVKDPQPASAKVLNVASAQQQPSPNNSLVYDAEAERELFDLANQARAQAGAAPLQMDDGLTRAARAHAVQMAGQQQLSHQFTGEPAFELRLADNCTLHLDQAGENVAYAGGVDQVQQGLMHSPTHR